MTKFTKAESDEILDRMVEVLRVMAKPLAETNVADHDVFLAAILMANVAAIGMEMSEDDVAADVTEMRKMAEKLVRMTGGK